MTEDIPRRACPRCAEMIAVAAVRCRYCGYEEGPSLKRFIGADMTGMSQTRRTLNVIGFAFLILVVLLVILSL